jgi:hypothetical protein
MSINLYKNWDPSKGDYVDENIEYEISKRKKEKLRDKVQFIIFGIVFAALIIFTVWYAIKIRR